jgi:hypothetical protein
MLTDDLLTGRRFALIDPHGDLARTIADSVPHKRVFDTIYFDVEDPTHVIAFNPLAQAPVDRRSTVQSHILSAFRHIWSDTWGPRLEYILGNTTRFLLDQKDATLLSIPILLVNRKYRTKLLNNCTDPYISLFWLYEYDQYPDRLRSEAIAPIQNRIVQLVGNNTIR